MWIALETSVNQILELSRIRSSQFSRSIAPEMKYVAHWVRITGTADIVTVSFFDDFQAVDCSYAGNSPVASLIAIRPKDQTSHLGDTGTSEASATLLGSIS